MAIPERSITHNGKEYVSVKEFAERVNTSPQSINHYIRQGALTDVDVQKTGVRYLEWATQSVQYRIERGKRQAVGGSGRRKKTEIPIMKLSTIKDPSISSPKVAFADNNIQELNLTDAVLDLSKINPYDHKDCWIMVNDEPAKDPDGKPKLDFELLKTKITIQTYQVKLDKELRNVIPKEELIATVQGVCAVFKSAVDNIAQKYAAQLIAVAESISHHEFTPEEHTKVLNTLRNVPKEIFPSLQKELDKMVADAE